MILHIPHSSRTIPAEFREPFLLTPEKLEAELLKMTDAFTDELFTVPGVVVIRFPISRLSVDVARFRDDSQEPMTKLGLGKIYTRTADGDPLKRPLTSHEIQRLVLDHYDPHHAALEEAVRSELQDQGESLIIDCHSFPSRPLRCDRDQTIPRPDFCIGTDFVHSPLRLIEKTERAIQALGYRVMLNLPRMGAIVPEAFYGKERRVASITIGVNRSLYMDERTGERSRGFEMLKKHMQELLAAIGESGSSGHCRSSQSPHQAVSPMRDPALHFLRRTKGEL